MANTTQTKAELEKENDTLKETLAQMQEQMAQIMAQMNNNSAPKEELTSRKIKVMSLIPNPATLATERFGAGRSYNFPQYGTERKIRFDDLETIVNLTKQIAVETQQIENPTSFFERGEFYICDADAVEELGLSDCYEAILDKKQIDRIVALNDDVAVSLFEGANSRVKDNIVSMIVKNMVDGTEYDLNRISKISASYGTDINELADKEKKIKNK